MKRPSLPKRPRRASEDLLARFTWAAVVVVLVRSPYAASDASLNQYVLTEDAAVRTELPRALREISGLAVTADGRLFGHGDERAVISQIDPRSGDVVKAFELGEDALRGDFEGLAVAGDRFYLVTSDGIIYEAQEGGDGARVPYHRFDTGAGQHCEVEGLAFEAAQRTLLIACKSVSIDRLRGSVVVLRWSLDRREFDVGLPIRMSEAALSALTNDRRFRPTGIEWHSASGNLYLIAGPDGLIAEVTLEGRVLATKRLPRIHRQPEGIAFLPDMTMVIADEGRRRGRLTLYRRGGAE